MMKPSKKLIKALGIIANFERGNLYHEILPREFALLMWPDSPAWKHVINTGPNGATSGKGMWLCAGSYLNKLRYKGLVYRSIYYDTPVYGLTKEGHKLLSENQEK